jgi:endonuclease/exonuclease/phosphatase family metal-dependent hydrolase
MLVAGCASHRPADAPLRVMTFNIRLNLASDGPNAWPYRRDHVASMIRVHGADLIGLQEALPVQLEELDALLPEYDRFGVGRASDLGGEHTAVLYRKDRFEVVEHHTRWLSETPDDPGSKGWDAAYERIITWGKLRDRITGEVFYHFNTHFDHVGQVARRESARLVLRWIGEAARGYPVILTGDFNDVSATEPIRILEDGGLTDAFTASRCPHHGPASTWNGFAAIEPGRRIDFIFVEGPVAVLQHAILADTFDGRYPSDHLPVVADVMIGEVARVPLPCPAAQ